MYRHLSRTLLSGLVSLALSAPGAGQDFRFDFQVDGVLPSSDVDVAFYSNAGVPESSVYSVAGGILTQYTTWVSGNIAYLAGTDGGFAPGTFAFSPAKPTVMEARLRIQSIQGTYGGGVYFQAYDGVHRYSVFFSSTGFAIPTPTGFATIPVDVFDFHTYRLESPANSPLVDAYVDDALVFTGTAAAISGASGFGWGDGRTDPGHGGDVEWDFIRACNGSCDTTPPTADAGPDQSVQPVQLVYLDGSGSMDDTTLGSQLAYVWTLVKPSNSMAALSDPTSQTPSFWADVPGEFRAQLMVKDEAGYWSAPDEVVISSTNLAPTAEAGPDAVAVVSTLVLLDGSGSTDPEADPITFVWTIQSQPAGANAVLAAATTPTPTLTTDLVGSYVLQLVVSDPFSDSAPSTVTITAITAVDWASLELAVVSDVSSTLALGSFDANGHRHWFPNKVTEVCALLESGDLTGARHQIEKVIERTDGVVLRGAPDPKGSGNSEFKADFVVDANAQIELYSRLASALQAIAP